MTSDTTDRVWLITGTSSGFGRELATAALAAGDSVVATARRPESLDDLVATAPDRVHAVALDVTDAGRIGEAVGEALERFGRIDVLVNNAGNGSVGAVEEIESSELRELMDTMFFGPVELTQAVVTHMRERGSGAIVQMSSMGGQISPPGFGAYCSAKFALEAMSESLAEEVGALGIQVLIVEPGAFATGFGGARMHRSRPIAAYEESVGPTRAAVDSMDGSQEGDPAKAAAAILQVLAASDPPLRLALGSDAVESIRTKHRALADDLQRWETVSRSTAHQGGR